jgi:hypothetical protein
MKMDKSMSDGDVQEYAYKKLMGDLDPIESSSVFSESDEPSKDASDGVTITAHGVNVNIKPMAGEQTKEMPKEEKDDDADKRPVKLGL